MLFQAYFRSAQLCAGMTCLCSFSVGQSPIPVFESNTTDADRKNSFILNELEEDTSAVLAYTANCYWSTKRTYTLIRLVKGKWRSERWVVSYTSSDKEAIKGISKKRVRPNGHIDSLLAQLSAFDFWTISQDSLNISEQRVNDTTITSYHITDGCSWAIEVIHQGHYRKLWSYMPEEFQKLIPIRARERFIGSLHAMRQTLSN
jgi:hypothetical protein